MKYTYQLVDNDYIEFYKYNTKNTPSVKRRLLLIRILCSMFILLSTFVLLQDMEDSVTQYIFYVFVFAVALAILIFYRRFVIALHNRRRRKLRKNEGASHNKELTCEFLEDTMIISTQEAESAIKYSLVSKVSSGANAFYIYFSNRSAYILPFRVFAGEGERVEFFDFIQGKV